MCRPLIIAALRSWDRLGSGPRLQGADHTLYTHWLDDSVNPVVAALVGHPTFRALARWPIEELHCDSGSDSRRHILSVDAMLTKAAECLALLAEEHLPGDGVLPVLLRFVAQRPWHDLVSPKDYFGAVARLNLRHETQHDPRLPEGQYVWDGPNFMSFHPYACPLLRQPGDFVSRCAIKRVEIWRDTFRRFLAAMIKADNRAPLNPGRASVAALDSELSALRAHLIEGRAAQRRAACMALVQVYQALRHCHRSAAEVFPWLADADPPSYPGVRLRSAIDLSSGAIADSAMCALAELESIEWAPVDIESEIDEARRNHLLCVVDGVGRRELYWKQTLIPGDWQRWGRAWTLLIGMVEEAQVCRGVDEVKELGICLRSARRDLKRLLPADLFQATSCRRRVYQLHLASTDMALLRVSSDETLVHAGHR